MYKRQIIKIVLIVAFVATALFWFAGRQPAVLRDPSITELVDYSVSLPEQEKLMRSYQDFIDQAQEFSRPTTEATLQAEIKAAQHYLREHPEGKYSDDIQRTIRDTLNIGFLLDGIEERQLSVVTTAIHQRNGYTEQELIFDDPWVDTTKVHLLIPDELKTKPHPAVIGVHGHADSAATFRDKYFGAELAQAGFVVLIPAVQTLEHPDMDEILSKKLYLSGFTLMGVRVYKVHLFLKYLRHLAQVDNQRIGLMGHSGGSSTALLVAQLSPQDINSLAYDLDGTYLDLWADDPSHIHCETIPQLAYYRPQIHDVSELPLHTHKFDYGYSQTHDKKNVIRFLQEANDE